MFERKPVFDVFYVPWGDGHVDRHVAIGAAWLHQQHGRKAVFVPGKQNYVNNRTLSALTSGCEVITQRALSNAQWAGGPLLACWPTEQMFGSISDRLGPRVTAVCVLEWGDAAYQRSWITAHRGVDLTGTATTNIGIALPPVVLAAMETMSHLVDHSNGLVGSFDKAIAIGILQALVRAGYRYDVDEMCAWALANGFTAGETEHLRDYATKALTGHRFRLRHPHPLAADIVRQWEAAARQTTNQ